MAPTSSMEMGSRPDFSSRQSRSTAGGLSLKCCSYAWYASCIRKEQQALPNALKHYLVDCPATVCSTAAPSVQHAVIALSTAALTCLL